MDRLWQDLRYALRSLRRDPGFTALVVLVLAVGIGFDTAAFSVVRAVLLEPPPYPDPDRLVMLWTEIPAQGVRESPTAYGTVQDWRARARAFEDIATFDPTTLTLTDGPWPEKVSGVATSANLFSVIGVAPALGRAFTADDERERARVVVLSHELWRNRYGGAADAVGRTLTIAGEPFEVVGVMPEGFGFPGSDTGLWLPQSALAGWDASATQRGTGSWRVLARVRSDASLEQVRRELEAIAADVERAQPASNARQRIAAVRLQDQVTGPSVRFALWTLFGAVGLVLLIACANGAHMLLVRGLNRAQELAVRVSLGADAGRLLRQLLTESVVLALAAGAAGSVLAAGGVRVLLAVAPATLPRLEHVRVDGVVLAYAIAVSLAVGLLFGALPVRGLLRGAPASALREGRSASPARHGQAGRRLLIVVQLALAIVLVFGAGVLGRSFLAARRVDPGFRPDGVLIAGLSQPDAERRLAFYDQVVRDVAATPGVASAGVIEEIFLSGAPNAPVTVEGRASAEPAAVTIRADATLGDVFGTLGVPLVEGRAFTAGDGEGTVPVAIVNETMARRFWPGRSPIGGRFRLGGPEAEWLEAVGVVGDMRRQGPERAPFPQLFRPYAQAPSRNMVLLVRAEPGASDLVSALRTRIAAIDRAVPLAQVAPLARAMDRYLADRRFQTLLLGLFSAVALALAAVGVYGLIQHSVAQRTREIGVRVALGGTSRQVAAMVLRQGLAVALQGLAAGVLVALLLSGPLARLFFGAQAMDLTNVAVTAGILLVVTVLACWVPARRASRVDPIVALRQW